MMGSVGSFGISESIITKQKHTHTHTHTHAHTEYAPNHHYQWRSNSDAPIYQEGVGAGHRGVDCIIGP